MSVALEEVRRSLIKADELFRQGQYAEAERLLLPLLVPALGLADANLLAGLTARELGKLDLAEQRLSAAHGLAPKRVDIINILANVRAQRGNFDAALAGFEAALAINPDFDDAHLNRALIAQQAGRADQALEFVETSLRRWPTHARLLALKAALLKELGDLPQALQAFEIAILSDPGRALTRYNHAITLRAAGRYEEACVEYRRAAELGIRSPDLASNWAAAALEAGQVEQARDLYTAALRLDPTLLEAHSGLTRLIWEYEGREDAFDHYRSACATSPEAASLWMAWLNELRTYRQYDEAVAVAAEALKVHPDRPEFELARGAALCYAGNPDGAHEALTLLHAGDADNVGILTTLMICDIMRGEGASAAAYGERASLLAPQDQGVWAHLATAWAMTGDVREDWLCGYERFICHFDIADRISGLDCGSYATVVADTLDGIHDTVREPGNQSLRSGTQTSSSLFERDIPAIGVFRQNLFEAIREYISALPDDRAHPFLSRKGAIPRFTGSWSVRLKGDGGHHVSHFHGNGWTSSAFYARLPATLGRGESHAGHIQFGVPPEELGVSLPARRIVCPAPGRLVLFPSYVWHGTIPFPGNDTRLTAAFDIVAD